MFEKNLNIAFLLDFYGEVLTERCRDVLEMYYCDDLSLSEIADSLSISRQGARHIIKKGEEELTLFESKLGLAARFTAIKGVAAELNALAEELSSVAESERECEIVARLCACADVIAEKNRE
ncbi:MAG: DNA-binding protein [Clostridia bacterium]|nr:DNA-binding protein [Clostridia bacterium]